MNDIQYNWISVGDSMFERIELYKNDLEKTFDNFVPAPFGGPILIIHENLISIHAASGTEISKWKWRTGGKIITVGWSRDQELVFVIEDGTVIIYTIYGELIKTTSMGQEAKDVKIRDAQVFRSNVATGVTVLTTSNRFFVVNNLKEPRVRRLFDADLRNPGSNPPSWPWKVMASVERQAKIIYMNNQDMMILSLSEVKPYQIDTMPEEMSGASQIVLSPDSSKIAILSKNGILWIGRFDEDRINRIVQVKGVDPSEIAWCGSDAVIGFAADAFQYWILNITTSHSNQVPDLQKEFFTGFISVVSEIDCARVYSVSGQEMIRKLPQFLVNIYASGSVSPGAELRLATEEFLKGSHRADEYIRRLEDNLNQAVEDCLKAAGIVHDPEHQKTLMKAAQFGTAFCKINSSSSAHSSTSSSEKFSTMCKNLRVLNAIKEYKIGMPLTMSQFDYLSPKVVIDRLLQRRLFALASKMCQFMQIQGGHSRVLAHWACYKVAQEGEDSEIAATIKKRLGEKTHDISYCDVADKAAECGKTELAIHLLESETSVSRQVPLLIKLGQEASALSKALNSGNRDLAYSVILHLRKNNPSYDFHMLIRKSKLGKVLYESYCAAHDPESLQDWYQQEDDYASMALLQVESAMSATSIDTRLAKLVDVQTKFKNANSEPLEALAKDHHMLLKSQAGLQEKLGKDFVGLTLHQTLSDLIQVDEIKLADKLRQDFKLTDRRYTWIKLTTWARTHKWNELKRYAKQKKLSVPVSQVVKLANQHGGPEAAKMFLSEEFLNTEDRYNLFSEFGMYVEAAKAAFDWKNLDALTSLEAMCVGRDDILKSIQGYKTKLIGSSSSSWRK